MVYVFCDYRIPSRMKERLEDLGFVVLLTKESKMLSSAVCGHVDLGVVKIGTKVLVRREVVEWYPALLGCEKVVVSEEYPTPGYPDETRFCVKVVGDTLYHGMAVAGDVLCIAREEGLSTCMVKQGYVACNLLTLDDSHAITSDASLEKVLSARGVKVFRIREGFISLPPYPYGFIGGACGVWDKKVYFLGNVMSHPDGERMVKWIASCGFSCVSLSDGELFDGGGLVFLESELLLAVGENTEDDAK